MMLRFPKTLFLLSVFLLAYAGIFANVIPVRATDAPILCLTFDDGYASHYNYAFPYLDTLDIPASFAVPTLNATSGDFEGIATMTWAQVHDLKSHGFDIASHGTGYTINMASASEAAIIEDLNQSATFDEEAGFEPDTFIIPWGFQNATFRVLAMGYYANAYSVYETTDLYDANIVFSVENETILAGHRYRVPRVCGIIEWANKSNEAAVITSWKSKVDQLVANGTGFAEVLMFHHITDSPRGSPYQDISPAVFTAVVDYAVAQGVDFVSAKTLDGYFGSGVSGGSGMTSSLFEMMNEFLPLIFACTMMSVVVGLMKFGHLTRSG